MRTSGTLFVVIAILALGFVSTAYLAQSTHDAAVVNGTNASATAYNLTEDVQRTVGQTLPPALVLGGLVALAIVGAGLLVAYGPRGR